MLLAFSDVLMHYMFIAFINHQWEAFLRLKIMPNNRCTTIFDERVVCKANFSNNMKIVIICLPWEPMGSHGDPW
jgi:hypothetical protein